MCHSIFDRNYTADTAISTILQCVYGLLLNPDVDDPLDSTLALEFYNDNGLYETSILEHVQRHAMEKSRDEWRKELSGANSEAPKAGAITLWKGTYSPSGKPSSRLMKLVKQGSEFTCRMVVDAHGVIKGKGRFTEFGATGAGFTLHGCWQDEKVMCNMSVTVPSVCKGFEIKNEGTSTSTGLTGNFTCSTSKDVGTFEYIRARRPTYCGKPDFLVGDVVTVSGCRGRGCRKKNGKTVEIIELKGCSKTVTKGVLGVKYVVRVVGTDDTFEVKRTNMKLLEEL